jgi:hypothetical protein
MSTMRVWIEFLPVLFVVWQETYVERYDDCLEGSFIEKNWLDWHGWVWKIPRVMMTIKSPTYNWYFD